MSMLKVIIGLIGIIFLTVIMLLSFQEGVNNGIRIGLQIGKPESAYTYNSGYDAGFINGVAFGVKNEFVCYSNATPLLKKGWGYCTASYVDRFNTTMYANIFFGNGTMFNVLNCTTYYTCGYLNGCCK